MLLSHVRLTAVYPVFYAHVGSERILSSLIGSAAVTMQGSPDDEPRTDEVDRGLELIFDASEGTDTQSRVGISIQGIVHHDGPRVGLVGEVAPFGEEDPMIVDGVP